jgi:pyruvate ferredoxin oxidoreductase beta subunit
MDKVARAQRLSGPKMFISLAACPPGWGVEAQDSVALAKLAVDTGVWPLKEVRDGKVVHTVVPHARKPLEDYLKLQQRYRHLFEPQRQERLLLELQTEVDRYWSEAAA